MCKGEVDMTLRGKCVVLAVTGSIAAYKIASLASMLTKKGCEVHVIMTKNATKFIAPITFETLTGNKCLVNTFDRNFVFEVEHISLAQKADMVMIAPATANVLAKLAYGMADDMLTTTVLACECPKYIAPTMNKRMYANPIVQDNIARLESFGFKKIIPSTGYLACGEIGEGKMPEPSILFEYIMKEIAYEKDLQGKNVLVTAGPTQEKIDPVRFITNHSSGKMGYALAKAAMRRGATVTLVTGPTNQNPPMFVDVVNVTSAEEMFNSVKNLYMEQDLIFKSAAVADYTPKEAFEHKVKKNMPEKSIELEQTKDILKYLGENKRQGQILCGFSMETENLIENSKVKLAKKNLDLVVANNLNDDGAGFKTDTNVVTLIDKDGAEHLPMLTKEDVAHKIIDKLLGHILN